MHLDRVTYRVVSDNNQRLVQLEGGTADLVERVPLDLVTQIRDAVITEVPSASVSLIGFNGGGSPTDNVDFRRAVSLSVDRTALIESVYSGKAEPNNGLLPASLPGSVGSTMDWGAVDLAAAEAALERPATTVAGRVPRRLERGIDLLAAQAIQPMLQAIGLETNIVTVDSATSSASWAPGKPRCSSPTTRPAPPP